MYLFTDSGASINFTGCTFSDNRAINGASGSGGIYYYKALVCVPSKRKKECDEFLLVIGEIKELCYDKYILEHV